MIEPRHDLKWPRPWAGLFFAARGWVSLLAGLVLIGITVFSANYYLKAQRLETNGAWVSAEIVAMRISRGDDSDSYFATFTYQVEDRDYRKEKNVGSRYYRRHGVGDSVKIKYWISGPQLFEVTAGNYQKSARVMQFVALGSGIVALGALWYSGGRANSAVLARRKGYRTIAKITNIVERKNSGKPTGRGYMIFQTPENKRGESLDHNIRKLRALGTGTEIVVYVRKDDVWWEGDVGPRDSVPRDFPKVT